MRWAYTVLSCHGQKRSYRLAKDAMDTVTQRLDKSAVFPVDISTKGRSSILGLRPDVLPCTEPTYGWASWQWVVLPSG